MIEVVLHYQFSNLKIVVCTDSSYVHGGLQGGALNWRTSARVTPQGPVTNVDLWITLMNLVDATTVTREWLKVPSHVGSAGNERADVLAANGHKSSPLYANVKHPLPLPRTPLVSPVARREEVNGVGECLRTIELRSV